MKLKNLHTLAGAVLISLAFQNSLVAQCGALVSGGSAFNMLTLANNHTNPVVVDKALNTVVFVHRHNSNVFGGNSGNFRYDVSTNGGTSWTNNVGVLNPLNTNFGRYPNAVIYNPAANTSTANAYIGYMGATVDPSSGYWNGLVTGVRRLNGTGNTEHYNQTNNNSYLTPASMVKGAPGVFWGVNLSSDGNNATGDIFLYKGVWNNATSDITWTTAQTFSPPFDLSYNGSPQTGNYNISFDPTGTVGWFSMITELYTGPAGYNLEPVFYKTVDGGNTWQGPIEVDLDQLGCITSNILSGYDIELGSNADMTVDINGNPHLLVLTGSGNASGYGIVYADWHHLIDITQVNGVWTAYDVSAVNGSYAAYYGSVTGSYVYQFTSPQVSRSADGKKVFFGWTDNSSYTLGDLNEYPDLFGRGLDVVQNKWTNIKDFSSCNGNTSGQIFFPHIASEVLEPANGIYKLAPFYGEFTVFGDPESPVNFKFLDNATFLSTDFSINQPTLNVSILQGDNLLLCPGSNLNLQITGTYSEVHWSNNYTGNTSQVNSAGHYYVGARSGCVLGSDSIVVKTLTTSVTTNPAQACEGSPLTIHVSGNAYNYSLSPSMTQGTVFTVYPNTSNINSFSIIGTGDQSCTVILPVSMTLNPIPSVVVIGQSTVCPGQPAVLQSTGTNISLYSWSSGATASSATVFPNATTVYTLTVISSAGCSTSTTITQAVFPACVGINTLSKESELLQLYPNPSAGDVTIKTSADVSLQLINELGQLVRTISLNAANDHKTTVSGLAKGIYFVTGQSNGQVLHQKIVIE